MKKIITSSISAVLFLLILLIVILLTIGIETNKFNEFISKKVSQAKNIDLDLDTIKFKIDLKELSLFLEAKNPKITYREVYIPAKNIKVYINFVSLIKSDVKLKKLNLNLKELDITQLNKLSSIIKPSNFKSILNNKIKKGKLISEIEIFLKEDGTIKDFIAKGTIKNLEAELFSNIHFRKINLTVKEFKKIIDLKVKIKSKCILRGNLNSTRVKGKKNILYFDWFTIWIFN